MYRWRGKEGTIGCAVALLGLPGMSVESDELDVVCSLLSAFLRLDLSCSSIFLAVSFPSATFFPHLVIWLLSFFFYPNFAP